MEIARGGYSKQEIIDVLHGKYGSRAVKFRYDLLDKKEQFKSELKSVLSGEVSMASLATIKRTAKFTIKETSEIDWLNDRIQPFMELKVPEIAKHHDTSLTNQETTKQDFESGSLDSVQVTEAGELELVQKQGPVFTRASTAYDDDGVQVANDLPRFDKVRLLQEGTTNLFSSPLLVQSGVWTKEAFSAFIQDASANSPQGEQEATRLTYNKNGWVYQRWSSLSAVIKTYTASAWMRSADGLEHDCPLFVWGYNGAAGSKKRAWSTEKVGSEWKLFTLTYTKAADETIMSFGIMDSQKSGDIYVWGSQLEEKDHATPFVDGTREDEWERGLRVEEGTTNVSLKDGQDGVSPWWGDGTGVVTSIDPVVLFRGRKVAKYKAGTSTNCYINSSVDLSTAILSTNWASSLYIKRVDGTPITLIGSYLSITNNANDNTAATIEQVEDGWYKVTRARTGLTSGYPSLMGCYSLVSGAEYYIADWQVEPKSYPTSYCMVTRASEIAIVPLSAELPQEFGLGIKLKPNWSKAKPHDTVTYRTLIYIANGAADIIRVLWNPNNKTFYCYRSTNGVAIVGGFLDINFTEGDTLEFYFINLIDKFKLYIKHNEIIYETGYTADNNLKDAFNAIYLGCAGDSSRINGVISKYQLDHGPTEAKAIEYLNATEEPPLIPGRMLAPLTTDLKLGAAGQRFSPAIDLAEIGRSSNTEIIWNGTGTQVEASIDDGGSWQPVSNGGKVPQLITGTDVSDKKLLLRQTISTDDVTTFPKLNDITLIISGKKFYRKPPGWVEFPLGIFLLSSPKRKEQNGQVYRQVDAYDGLIILLNDKFDSRYTISAGTRYYDAVITILQGTGITKFNIEQTDHVLSRDIEFVPGKEKLYAINGLLSQINFTPLHVDVYGYYTASTYRSPSIRTEDYSYITDGRSVVFPGQEEELDLFNVPNKWVVIRTNAEEEPLISVYENNNPDSPTSYINRGFWIVDYREVTDVANQQALDAYTQRIAFEASQIYGKVSFETALMPFHDYANVLGIDFGDLGLKDKYSETGWKLPLVAGGKMKHEIRKVVQI